MWRLLLSCAIFLSPALTYRADAQEVGTRAALVITNVNYIDAPLPNVTAITNEISKELRLSGFEVDFKEDLGKAEMQNAIDAFKSKIRAGMTVFFFFHGYGLQVAKQTYLLPINAQIWTEADIRRDGTSLDSVLSQIHATGAQIKIVVIDAAHQNPFDRRLSRAPSGLATLDTPENTLSMYSVVPGKLVLGAAGGSQVFMMELVKELRAPNVDAEEIFNRARVGVSAALNNEQIPWVSSSLAQEFFFRAPYQGGPAPRLTQALCDG
jgi:uncharacterized caspase-like protein